MLEIEYHQYSCKVSNSFYNGIPFSPSLVNYYPKFFFPSLLKNFTIHDTHMPMIVLGWGFSFLLFT